MYTWLPEFGDCECVYTQYTNKKVRDYNASQAKKTEGYLTHKLGQYHVLNKGTVYTLSIYYK